MTDTTAASTLSAAAAATPADDLPRVAVAPLVYLKLLAVAMFWGGTFIAGRIVSQVLPPMSAAAGRFALAAVLLVLLTLKTEGRLPRLRRSQMLSTFALGLTGIFIYNVCFFSALAHMPAGRTALFVALNPIVTALALAALFGERLGKMKWLGIVLAFCGASIIITRGDLAGAIHDISQSLGMGELLMLCAITSWAAYTIIGRFVLRELSPLTATTYAALWGLALLLCGASTELPSLHAAMFTWKVVLSLAYLGIFGTVIGFVWYYEGVKAVGSSRAAVFNNLVPVFGITFASLLLGETILASMVIGGLIAIAGVALTNRTAR
jgi:drug/metabolite transporter (DMT)-like permease